MLFIDMHTLHMAALEPKAPGVNVFISWIYFRSVKLLMFDALQHVQFTPSPHFISLVGVINKDVI